MKGEEKDSNRYINQIKLRTGLMFNGWTRARRPKITVQPLDHDVRISATDYNDADIFIDVLKLSFFSRFYFILNINA